MVDFAMCYLDESKYYQLLRKDFEKNKEYSTLSTLRRSYLFDRAEKLFKYLNPEDITDDDYSTSMYAALAGIVSVPNDQNFINAGYKMLSTMWQERFEECKQFFINKLSYGSSSASEIAQLVKAGRFSDILSEIVETLSIEQAQNLQKSESWVYEILKTASLFNDDVMQHLVATKQINVKTFESQEELVVLGVGSSIDNQEAENA